MNLGVEGRFSFPIPPRVGWTVRASPYALRLTELVFPRPECRESQSHHSYLSATIGSTFVARRAGR